MSALLHRDFIWFPSCRTLSAVAFYPLNITTDFSKFCSVSSCLLLTHAINTVDSTAHFRFLPSKEVLKCCPPVTPLDFLTQKVILDCNWELGTGIPSPTGIPYSKKTSHMVSYDLLLINSGELSPFSSSAFWNWKCYNSLRYFPPSPHLHFASPCKTSQVTHTCHLCIINSAISKPRTATH